MTPFTKVLLTIETKTLDVTKKSFTSVIPVLPALSSTIIVTFCLLLDSGISI